MSRRSRIAAATAAAILFGAYWLTQDSIDGGRSDDPTIALPVSSDRGVPDPAVDTGLAAARPLPSSLVGTEVDGALIVDASGRFEPTPDAIDFFDYYLSALGEETEAEIRARIVSAISQRLKGEAARAAVALLDDYLRYRARAAGELGEALAGVDLERRLQYIRELRRDVFGADVARALFAEEEARWFADLERRRIALDPEMDPEERERRLARLDTEQSEKIRTLRDAPRAHRLLRDEEARLRSRGADATEIDVLREERFGRETATRLAALDSQRLEWQARLAAYRVERDALPRDTDPAQQAKDVEALRLRHFENGELIRVRALDQIQGNAN